MKILPPAFALVAVSIVLFSSCGTSVDRTSDAVDGATENSIAETPVQPDVKVDLYGKIVSMEGNEITVSQVDTSKDPTFNMSADEKRKYMQSMDEAARMALKETINSAVLGNVKATVPVGIPMIRKTAQ